MVLPRSADGQPDAMMTDTDSSTKKEFWSGSGVKPNQANQDRIQRPQNEWKRLTIRDVSKCGENADGKRKASTG
jgi:hypothetical protein